MSTQERKRHLTGMMTVNEANAGFFNHIMSTVDALVDRTIGQERSLKSVLALAERMGQIADLATAELVKLHPEMNAIACAPGCSHCCRKLEIVTDAPTVFSLAFQARQGYSAAQFAAFEERLSALESRPCVFLVEDRCSVYGARPIACRSFNAMHIDLCAAGRFFHLDGDEERRPENVDLWRLCVGAAIADGVATGLERNGFDGRQLHLRSGLQRIFGTEGSVELWLAGEPIFDGLHQGQWEQPAHEPGQA
jgi:Fe-S-cluster containining protein